MQGTIGSFVELCERLEQKRQRLFDIARGLAVEQQLLLKAIYDALGEEYRYEGCYDRKRFRVGDAEFQIHEYSHDCSKTYSLGRIERNVSDIGSTVVETEAGIGPSHKFMTEAQADTAIAAAESSQPTEQLQCNKKTPVEKTKPRKKSK